ncbi:hypothetical protein FSP39_007777 [Pinctada imbricata]|uniref:Uncharacterized protein n=1 Tax=Pinctada imbricata TaxID=66713 RepID=A0AA88XLE3_PINIB|nr:hypothetical protein FSP39_007777 [Pinctada imbricata]
MHDSVSSSSGDVDTTEDKESDQTICTTKRSPRVDPQTADTHRFWMSPFTTDQTNIKSAPNVLHVVENREDLVSSLHHLRGNFYLPLTKNSVFHSHWLQKLLDIELKFYLHPMHGHNAVSSAYYEGLILLRKLRYVLARFEWNPEDPIKLQLSLAENHGNVKLHKKKRMRPLFSHTVYVDHSTSTVLFKGHEFLLTLTQPYPGDLESSVGDPGGRIDVGLYTRELDTAPDIKARWFLSLERRYWGIAENQPIESIV